MATVHEETARKGATASVHMHPVANLECVSNTPLCVRGVIEEAHAVHDVHLSGATLACAVAMLASDLWPESHTPPRCSTAVSENGSNLDVAGQRLRTLATCFQSMMRLCCSWKHFGRRHATD